MKKKLVFMATSLNVGGIETALVSLLSSFDYDKYDVTLILEKKEGIFLDDIPKEVRIKEYKISACKITFFRKIFNRIKLILTILLNYNKYHFSASFSTSSIPGSILMRYFSKNNAIWVHNDYYYSYDENELEMKKYLDSLKITKFKKVIFVASEAKGNFLKIYPEMKERSIVCNNLIKYEQIYKKAEENVDEKKPKGKTVFLNISRHDETQKRLTRLFDAAERLSKETNDFEVWMIGSGPEEEKYKKIVKEKKLEEIVLWLGVKKNPYPYYKLADYFILTSEYEGFPVVYVESLLFDLPILTTIPVSDQVINIEKDYGIIMKKEAGDIYLTMKRVIDNKFVINEKFDPIKFNEEIKRTLETLINGGASSEI